MHQLQIKLSLKRKREFFPNFLDSADEGELHVMLAYICLVVREHCSTGLKVLHFELQLLSHLYSTPL